MRIPQQQNQSMPRCAIIMERLRVLAMSKGHATVKQLLEQAAVIKRDPHNKVYTWNPEQAPSAANQSVPALAAAAANAESSTPARTAEDAGNEVLTQKEQEMMMQAAYS